MSAVVRSTSYRIAACSAFVGLALFGAFTFKGWALAFVVFFLAAAGWELFAWRWFDR